MSEPNKPAAPAPAPAAKKKDNTKTIIIVCSVLAFFLLVPVLIFSVGAGIVGHKVINGVKVSSDGKSTTIQTKNGDQISAGGNQSLPKDLPSNVPIYKGNIVSSNRLTIEGKVTWSVIIETKDDPAKISDGLSQSYSTNGWTSSMDNKTSEGGLIAAENGDLHVQVIYTTKDGKTTISYTVVPVNKESVQ